MLGTRSKSLLIVVGSLERGGCEVHLTRTLPRLVDRGYKVSIFLLSGSGPLRHEMESGGVKIFTPWFSPPKNMQRNILNRVLRLSCTSLQFFLHLIIHRPTILHIFLPASYWLAGPLSIPFFGIKKVMSRRSQNTYLDNRPWIRFLELFLHKRMDIILGNSKSVIKQLVKQEGVPEDRVKLIYNGIDIPSLDACRRSEIRHSLNISDETVVLVIVANLIPYKGHADLIRALAIANKSLQSDWRLLIIGRDDGIGRDLYQQVEEMNLSQKIQFIGTCDNVVDYLAAADVGLLVSQQEGFSNAILESMAMSLPMIVTDAGGNKEAVVHDQTGFVVPVKDINALSLRIQQLINNRELREQMGQLGHSRIVEQFSIDQCINDYVEVYTSLLR